MFHFAPSALKEFRLVVQNEGYRIYEMAPPSGIGKGPASAVYDIAQYGPQTLPDGTVKLDVTGALRRMETARLKFLLGRILAQLGRGEQALSSYEESFAAWPPDAAGRGEYEKLRAQRLRAR